MLACSSLPQVDQAAVAAAIANSPIVARGQTLEARLADWQTTRQAPDVDAVILAWLASHARGRRRAVLS